MYVDYGVRLRGLIYAIVVAGSKDGGSQTSPSFNLLAASASGAPPFSVVEAVMALILQLAAEKVGVSGCISHVPLSSFISLH